ncbi:L-seryl-tRNA(Sec) selenium transferase [bacterium]|nr:L-seryl-tRNA(Sec) selenium transferase [bacterium]MBU1633827.1 L-seryl-tRNA(Sec) selenium transferase [bacterium]MBU1872914.1 L-seryl-tRNA(Sec) selenium transferase [bacterium]
MVDTIQNSFKNLPSVQQLIDDFENTSVKPAILAEIIRQELEQLRQEISKTNLRLKSKEQTIGIIVPKIKDRIQQLLETPLKRVVNATGVVLHTGLGRAPLGERVFQFLMNIAPGYLNLEFNIQTGKRGERLDLIDDYLCLLTGAEYSAVVNNNAAAVMLALNSLANRKEVIVSRGELIEIGGSFRLPDVMKKSGAKMIEVGTTNRTHLQDYGNAITSKTGAVLIAHTSNYRVQGFTKKPAEVEIIELAHRKLIPVILDLGSGALLPLETLGLPKETVVADAVSQGFDVITFSGDKLLGGSQAGLIVGKTEFIQKIRKNTLMRVLRCDKISLSLLTVTLSRYILNNELPDLSTLTFLTRDRDQLRAMAQGIVDALDSAVSRHLKIEVCDTLTEAGSGSMPTETIPSVALRISATGLSEETLAQRFRQQDPPVIGYINERRFYLDLKAVADTEIVFISNAINKVAASLTT